jgi:hypothetical protein
MKENVETKIQLRRITLEDGRYLIFYTFGDADESALHGSNDESEDQRED